MVGTNRAWFLRKVLFVIVSALLVGMMGGSATADTDQTYIEFIFDASFSMNEQVEKSKSRMDVARVFNHDAYPTDPFYIRTPEKWPLYLCGDPEGAAQYSLFAPKLREAHDVGCWGQVVVSDGQE